MSEVLLPGLEGFTYPSEHSPDVISPLYQAVIKRLVDQQSEGVTVFHGAPLELGNEQRVWLSPVEVDDGEKFSYYQLLFVNTVPEVALNDTSIGVTLLDIDEASFKLAPVGHPAYNQLTSHFLNDDKQILIRKCNSGMAYYPRSIVPSPWAENHLAEAHLAKLVKSCGLREPEISVSLSKPSEEEDLEVQTSLIDTAHTRRYHYEGHEIFSYGLVLPDDPWKYYEIFTPKPLDKMSSKDMYLRIDSGCDIGQIYDDKGCDCREQLHKSLSELRGLGNGAVVHIAAQDGRGYGTATKMETEGLKQGVEVVTNKGKIEKQDTVTAARTILGERFDIRTFNGVGRILEMLGVSSVVLETDNRLKAEGLRSAGIQVKRQATGTTGGNGSKLHVQAKHQHSEIYYGDGEEQ